MLTLNRNFYLMPDRAPQIHSGMGDLYPDPNNGGEGPMVPSGISSTSLAALPAQTWGACWGNAPDPGQSGTSSEIIAAWGGLPATFPPVAADLRVPGVVRYHERTASDALFTTAASFKAAIAAKQTELGRAVACWEATGVRYDDLNTSFSDASEGCETRDVLRESDGSKVGEAFLYRSSATQTVQHWVLRNDERFDQVRVVKRTSGGYASLSAFLTAQANARSAGVRWPHAVETVTHHLSCPW